MKTPITKTELASLYGISRKTFYSWLKKKNIRVSNGCLNPNELEIIFNAFGFPEGLDSKK